MFSQTTENKAANFIHDLKKNQNINPKHEYLLLLFESYQHHRWRQLDDLSFNKTELEHFILYLMLDGYKAGTILRYVTYINKLLKEFYNIEPFRCKTREIAERVLVITRSEFDKLILTDFFGYRKKIVDLFLFMLSTGCEYGKFALVNPEYDHNQIYNYLNNARAHVLFAKYKGKLPDIPKKDFEITLRQIFKELKIDRMVRSNAGLIPLYELNKDLLIRNTFMYKAVAGRMTNDSLWKMFEHSDFSKYMPAVACVNNLYINAAMNKKSTFLGLVKLISKSALNNAGNIKPNSIHQSTEALMSLNMKPMLSLGFNDCEIFLTDYMTLLSKSEGGN